MATKQTKSRSRRPDIRAQATKSLTRKIYMCGIDWQEEHWAWHKGYSIDAPEIFRSVKELKAKRSCWQSCGIVEIEMRVTGWPVEQDLFSDDGQKISTKKVIKRRKRAKT